MGKSRRNCAINENSSKCTWKDDYNSKFRAKSKQILKQIVEGDIDPDEAILPETHEDVSDAHKEQKSIWFLDEDEADEDDRTCYRQALCK